MLALCNFRPTRFLLLAYLLFAIGSLSSCKVQLVPSFNAILAQDIVATAKKIDNFYLSMHEVPVNKRQYQLFTNGYVLLEADLNSLLNQNKVRPLNKESTRISEIAVTLWIKYKTEHKTDDTLSDGLIKLNRKTLSDLLYAMQVAEDAKNIPNP